VKESSAKPKDWRLRLQHLLDHAEQILARRTALEARTNAVLWPARAASYAPEAIRNAPSTADLQWEAFDRQWLSPCFVAFHGLRNALIVALLLFTPVEIGFLPKFRPKFVVSTNRIF
jgi:hypothetical protein